MLPTHFIQVVSVPEQPREARPPRPKSSLGLKSNSASGCGQHCSTVLLAKKSAVADLSTKLVLCVESICKDCEDDFCQNYLPGKIWLYIQPCIM
jgi:hypothetical protein